MRVRTFAGRLAASLLSLAAVAAPARADWEPPKDGVVTDKQVTTYLTMTRELFAVLKASGKAAEATPGAPAAMALLANADAKVNAIKAKTGMSEDEIRWVGDRVMEARGALISQDIVAQARAQMAEGAKRNAADVAAAKQQVAAYEAAIKAGRKVLSADDRKSAVESAKADEASALAEAKSHDAEAATATADAAEADAEAKAADALAAKPPADVAADARAEYVDGKKRDAESARSTAAEARAKVAEERKQSAEYKAKAAAAAAKARDPDLPSAEELPDVKKANEEGLASAKAQLQAQVDAGKMLADGAGEMEKTFAVQQPAAPKANVDLIRKRKDEVDAVWSGK